MHRTHGPDRAKATIGVAALHLLLGYAFISGLGVELATAAGEDLRVFAVAEPLRLPPEPRPVPAKVRAEAPEGAASPPSLHARATPVVAPPPEIRIDRLPLMVVAPEPAPAAGTDLSTGAADVDGPGTGSGGEGVGLGSGIGGSGTGGGGAAKARRISGAIDGATDYPRAARRAGIQGSVSVRFTVKTDGSVAGCRVTRSSGHPALDETTCRLVQRRFRYEPARDAAGRPASENVSRTFDWLLPGRG